MLDRNKLIADIVGNVEHAIGLQKMGNHFDVVQFKQNQAIVSINIEIGVSGESHLEFFVFFTLGDEPAVMDEFSSVLEVWIHDYGHEIVHLYHLDEKVIKWIVKIICISVLLDRIISFLRFVLYSCSSARFLKDIVVLSYSLIQSMISVGHCKESDCRSILNELKQVLVIFNGLLSQLIIHRC